VLLPSLSSAAQKVTLIWQASPGSDIAGYCVYCGLASGQYGTKVTVTNGTSATISGLAEGSTYFFVVTAFNTVGLESPPSNEVAYLVPGVVLKIQKVQVNGYPNAFTITSTGATPPRWALESSQDFKTWRTVTRGTNSAVNVTVANTNIPVRYFRLHGQ
jgi:hypothetical protein